MTSETELLANFDAYVAEQHKMAAVVGAARRKADVIPEGFELRRDGVYRSILRRDEWEWVKFARR